MRGLVSVILGTIFLVVAFAFTAVFQSSAQTAKAPARKPTATAPASTKPAAQPAAAPCACPPLAQHVQPYTAKQEITRVQTLADGTTVTTVEVVYLARDAQGRTRRETVRSQNGDSTHFFEIWDYPTQTRYVWNAGANFAHVVTVYRPRPNSQNTAAPQPQPQRYFPFRSESLPPQTIDGLYVQGTRTTRTTPAGYVGNDRDLVTTTESWYAPSLGLQMHTVVDDPRNGKSTTETTDVQQADPDPALFEPPAGYQLKDANP